MGCSNEDLKSRSYLLIPHAWHTAPTQLPYGQLSAQVAKSHACEDSQDH